MRIPLNRTSDTPLYRQIESFLQEQIENGALTAQARLPATRSLANSLGVGRLTVSNAYAEMESRGLIYSIQGNGTFIANRAPDFSQPSNGLEEDYLPVWQRSLVHPAFMSAEQRQADLIASSFHPDLISFAEGCGDPLLFPLEDFRKAIQTVFRTFGEEALGYGEPGGYFPLRNTIAQILTSQGIPAHPDQIMITSGSQQGIHLVVHLLVKPGEVVLAESPTHMGFIDLCQEMGIRLQEIPMDDQGLQVETLEHLILSARPKLIYTVPNFQNPSGACLGAARRRQLVSLAQKYNIPILEDDFVGDLRYKGIAQPALKALDPIGNVIYVSTFSKILIPGLRVGFLVASGPVYQCLLSIVHSHAGSASNLMQHALDGYISLGRYQACLRKARQVFNQRRSTMLAALSLHMPPGTTWTNPMGGLFIWMKLPDGLSADALFALAARRHVSFTPGSLFYPGGRPIDRLRLNFSLQSPPRINQGIQRLGDAIRELQNSQ